MKSKYVKPMLALSLSLTVVVAGTLAYLTDSTDKLENNFTVSDEVDIDLNESNQDFDLIPGTTPTKDPTITVTKDSSHVFTRVVEKIPTKALDGGNNKFSDFVDYKINALHGDASGLTGVIYRADDTTTPINWYWKLVDVTDTEDGNDDNIIVDDSGFYADPEGPATTYTTVYALVGQDGKLLDVSSTDVMADPDNAGAFIPAEYPVLANDTVTIPTDLTQEQLGLLLTDATDDENATYDVHLAFQGFAIQTEGLDSLATEEAIYKAAAGIE